MEYENNPTWLKKMQINYCKYVINIIRDNRRTRPLVIAILAPTSAITNFVRILPLINTVFISPFLLRFYLLINSLTILIIMGTFCILELLGDVDADLKVCSRNIGRNNSAGRFIFAVLRNFRWKIHVNKKRLDGMIWSATEEVSKDTYLGFSFNPLMY